MSLQCNVGGPRSSDAEPFRGARHESVPQREMREPGLEALTPPRDLGDVIAHSIQQFPGLRHSAELKALADAGIPGGGTISRLLDETSRILVLSAGNPDFAPELSSKSEVIPAIAMKLSPQELSVAGRRFLSRLDAAQTILASLDELGLGSIAREGMAGLPAEMTVDRNLIDAKGKTSMFTSEIVLAQAIPNAGELLKHVAQHGTFPDVFTTAYHEKSHAETLPKWGWHNFPVTGTVASAVGLLLAQCGSGIAAGWLTASALGAWSGVAAGIATFWGAGKALNKLVPIIKSRIDDLLILTEAHAREETQRIPCAKGETTKEIAAAIHRGYLSDRKGRCDTPIERVEVGCALARELCHLGVPRKEIGALLENDTWDSSANTYPKLKALRDAAVEKWGFPNEEALGKFKEFMESFIELRRSIFQRQAKRIALEELLAEVRGKFSGQEDSDNRVPLLTTSRDGTGRDPLS